MSLFFFLFEIGVRFGLSGGCYPWCCCWNISLIFISPEFAFVSEVCDNYVKPIYLS